jgi:palmitoyltransferase ZDHHC9/14/18
MRYCDICNIFKPPTRCSHCYQCENCVCGFDHHCIWLGTCIGARNYFWYVLYLISMSSMIINIEVNLFGEIMLMDLSFNEVLSTKTHISIFIPFCFLFLLLVGALLCFHTLLICKNETTHEYLKDMYHLDKNQKATFNPNKISKIFRRLIKAKN